MIFCFITLKLLNSSDFKASWMAYSKHPSKWRISWTFSINCNVQMIIYVRIIQESFKLLHNLIKTIRWQQQNHKPQLFGVGYMDPFPPLTYLVKHLIVLIKTIRYLTKYVKKKVNYYTIGHLSNKPVQIHNCSGGQLTPMTTTSGWIYVPLSNKLSSKKVLPPPIQKQLVLPLLRWGLSWETRK